MNETAAVQQWVGALGALDFAVLGVCLAVLFGIAYLSGRKESDTADFFLGRRRVPGLVACLSFVATEVSAITILSVPATGYGENWQYLQFFVGSAASRLFIAFLFIPVFYKFNCTTIYEFLRYRFGAHTQYAGSGFFFVTRLAASGLRLYVACQAVSVLMHWDLVSSLLLFTFASIVFISFGGIKAVVWTGAFEAAVFYGAGLAVAAFLVLHIHGGAAEAVRVASGSGKLSLLNLKLSLADPTTFWVATLNAFFVGMTVFGTDQELMQRLLTVQSRRASQRALVGTILAGLPLVCIYLAIGTLLFVFYQQRPELPLPKNSEDVLSHFALGVLPFGLKGLLLSAVVLASIDSPLSSLSSSFVTDIYRPLISRGRSEKHYLVVSRLGVIGFGVILALIAYGFREAQGILWIAFKILGVTGGSTLGVFLFGILTRRRANRGNVIAMIATALCMALGLCLIETKLLNLGWSWLIVIGTAMTFGLSYLLSFIPEGNQAAAERGDAGV